MCNITRMKDNISRSFEMRHVIHDIHIGSGQWPRCDVTYGTVRCPRSYEITSAKKYTCQYIYFKNIFKSTKLKGGYDVDRITESNINTRQSIQ
jgi:hypothetical protein